MRPREAAFLSFALASVVGSPARAEWERRCRTVTEQGGSVYDVRHTTTCEDVWVDRAGESADRLRAAREFLSLCKEMGKPQEQCNAELDRAIKSGRLYGDGPQKE